MILIRISFGTDIDVTLQAAFAAVPSIGHKINISDIIDELSPASSAAIRHVFIDPVDVCIVKSVEWKKAIGNNEMMPHLVVKPWNLKPLDLS